MNEKDFYKLINSLESDIIDAEIDKFMKEKN